MKRTMYCIRHERMVMTGQMACMVSPLWDGRVHMTHYLNEFQDVELDVCEGPFTECPPPEVPWNAEDMAQEEPITEYTLD